MKKALFLAVVLCAAMCQTTWAQLPADGAKGYLYLAETGQFVTADGTLGDVGELFTVKDENATRTLPDGRLLPDYRFYTDHVSTGGDHGKEGGQTALSVRNEQRVTTTEDYGYGVFSLYLNDEGDAFRIMNAKNSDRGIHKQYDCLGYEGTTLLFVTEADAPYWKFMSEEAYNALKNQTDAPVISYETTDDAVVITVSGVGAVVVYVDGQEVDNPWTIARGTEDATIVVTATAQEDGKGVSETATAEITFPALPEELGEGYSNLLPEMFKHWDDAVNPTTNEEVACSYFINEAAIAVYGDELLTYTNFADLSDYDKLIVEVTEGTPRIYFNKVDGGKYNASDEAASGRIEITPAGGWAEKYYTVEDGTWTIDLKKMVAEKGYARLNGIKGPTYNTTVKVSKMWLYKKDETTSVATMADGRWRMSDAPLYNLSGQRVQSSSHNPLSKKGIYVVAGRKVVLK